MAFASLFSLSAAAGPIDYTITFTSTPSPFNPGTPLPTAGGFTYDSTTQLFSNFIVVWNGFTFDETSAANNFNPTASVPSFCMSIGGGAGAFLLLSNALSNCTTFNWNAQTNSSGSSFDFTADYLRPTAVSFGTLQPASTGPETGQQVGGYSLSPPPPPPPPGVPEPATAGLVGVALVSLTLARRKRRGLRG